MQPPALPLDESQRLKALRDTGLLDSPVEERFDRLTRLATLTLGTPIAIVSLVDADRQWFKSRQGLQACETSRSVSFCGHAILSDDIFEIPDATLDARFADNPLVTGHPHIRFYAGVPLATGSGHRIGTLCVISETPRQLTDAERCILRGMAECVAAEINHLNVVQQREALAIAQALGTVITNAQSQFIQQKDRHQAFNGLLNDLLSLTQSGYGFIGEILRRDDGQPYLKTYAITNIAWSKETHEFYEEHAPQGMEFTNLRTLFGAAMTTGETVIANDPYRDSRRGGLPHGHPALNSFLGVPIYHEGEMLAMFGLANRPGGYDERLVEYLRPLIATLGQLVHAARIRHQHEQIQAELQRLSRVASETTNGVVITNTMGQVQWINQGFTRMTGYSLDELLGKKPGDLLQGQLTDPVKIKLMREALSRQEDFEVEVVNYAKDGRQYWVRISCRSLNDAEGQLQGFMAVESDITLLKHNEERLRHLATHDALTGLPNRTLLSDRLAVDIARAKRDGVSLGVLLLDLDNFKVVNDSFGHHYGDILLKEVATRLSRVMRTGDTVARLGGDEYAAILSEVVDEMQVHNTAERLLSSLNEPVLINGQEFTPTASVGYCLFPNHGDDPDSLLRHADAAMYSAKGSGRGVVSGYHAQMDDSSQNRLRILTGLRQSVANGDFKLFYQPQVDIVTGQIIGAEALLRWTDIELGSIPPDRFIPVAEASGLILPIGEWVIETACQQIAAWSEAGVKLPVAINLSPYQFRQTDLPGRILAMCSRYRCPVHLLELEVTETAAMQSPELAYRQFAALADAGFSIALDDFGTGHSSLARLGQLRVNKLKIDRSFIVEVPGSSMYETLVRSTIRLGNEMNMKVVAEGVETVEQRAFLAKNGCPVYQGWLFSKAVPAAEFTRLVRKWPRESEQV